MLGIYFGHKVRCKSINQSAYRRSQYFVRQLIFGLTGLCTPSPSDSHVLSHLPPRQLRGVSLPENAMALRVFPIIHVVRLGVPFSGSDGLNSAVDTFGALGHSLCFTLGHFGFVSILLQMKCPEMNAVFRTFSKKSIRRLISSGLCAASLLM